MINTQGTNMTGHNIGADKLRTLVQRIEHAEQERKEAAEAVADIYKEAASAGYTVKVLRALIKERAQDPQKQRDFFAELDMYRSAVGSAA